MRNASRSIPWSIIRPQRPCAPAAYLPIGFAERSPIEEADGHHHERQRQLSHWVIPHDGMRALLDAALAEPEFELPDPRQVWPGCREVKPSRESDAVRESPREASLRRDP